MTKWKGSDDHSGICANCVCWDSTVSVTSTFGECDMEKSDHSGHMVSWQHRACGQMIVTKREKVVDDS